MKSLQNFAIVCAAGLVTAACEKTEERSAATAVPDTAVAVAPASEPAVSGREIAHILQTSNAVILRQASLAKVRLESGPVRALADSIIAGHTAYNLNAQRTFLAINTVPLEHDHSKRMVADGNATRRNLEALRGADFERTYIASEIERHQHVVALIDSVLITNARDPFLKELLDEYRKLISTHLDDARRLSQPGARN